MPGCVFGRRFPGKRMDSTVVHMSASLQSSSQGPTWPGRCRSRLSETIFSLAHCIVHSIVVSRHLGRRSLFCLLDAVLSRILRPNRWEGSGSSDLVCCFTLPTFARPDYVTSLPSIPQALPTESEIAECVTPGAVTAGRRAMKKLAEDALQGKGNGMA